jgi:hypothetical protein
MRLALGVWEIFESSTNLAVWVASLPVSFITADITVLVPKFPPMIALGKALAEIGLDGRC